MIKYMFYYDAKPWQISSFYCGPVEVLKLGVKESEVARCRASGHRARVATADLYDTHEAALEAARTKVEPMLAGLETRIAEVRAQLNGGVK